MLRKVLTIPIINNRMLAVAQYVLG